MTSSALPQKKQPPTTAGDAAAQAANLSQREIQVLAYIVQGKSNKEAAEALCISKRTVDFHLVNVYDKLNVNNRVQAYLHAVRLGLLS